MPDYQSMPISAPIDPIVTVLIARAEARQLIVCAGAGLSVARAADLPNGRELGRRLDARAKGLWASYVSPTKPENLIDTADAAMTAAGGLAPLQQLVLGLADFTGAAPNLGHKACSLLIAEGAFRTVLLWNWDECIEHSALEGERIEVLRSMDDLTLVTRPNVAKVHGCASIPSSLLITSNQLDSPPPWADAAFSAQLRDATAIFIGVGDIADYAERRLREFLEGDLRLDVYLVSPSIQSGWSESPWSSILPDLDPGRRIARTADEFLDQMLRLWARWIVDRYDAVTAGKAMAGIGMVRAALMAADGETVVRWCREVALRKAAGTSAVRLDSTPSAFVALAVLASDRGGPVRVLWGGACDLAGSTVNVMTLPEVTANTAIEEEARRRAARIAARGGSGRVTFLVSGQIVGQLGQSERDLLGDGLPDDILSGPTSIDVEYLVASELLGRVA